MSTLTEFDEKLTFEPPSKEDLLINIPDFQSEGSTTDVPSSPSEIHESLLSRAIDSLELASNYAFDNIKEDGHWCGELLSNSTVTSEHVFFRQSLGLDLSVTGPPIKSWLLSDQNPDGSWGIAPDYPGDISTSTEAYLALKILGVPITSPEMQRARKWILQAGGVATVRIFSRIFLAMFGLFPWDAVPQLPAEFILMPRHSPINIYKLSSWARSNVIPLLIIRHHEPCYALPNGTSKDNDYLDELWVDPSNKMVPYNIPLTTTWKSDIFGFAFSLIDKTLYQLGGLRRSPLRKYSLSLARDWILERQEAAGDWAGIIPPMHQGIQALCLAGYKTTDPVIVAGIEAIERFAWEDRKGKRIQACLSPVWDTIFMIRGLADAGLNCGVDPNDSRILKAVKWTKDRQILNPTPGDWRIYQPHLGPGGFAFEYHNTWYPDVDDTAVVILALLDQNPAAVESTCVYHAANWMLGMQNSDDGWAAFDYDNDKLWLNKIPFSDMGALCDPSTADVTGRIIEAFGLMLKCVRQENIMPGAFHERLTLACDRGIAFLVRTQEPDGSWYGRWGSNYIYGTSNVLCGLVYFQEQSSTVCEMVRRGVAWLKSVQNSDGGWGEELITYNDPSKRGIGPSTASQTAWGLMALLTWCDPSDENVRKAVDYLTSTQDERVKKGASWPERLYTGTGFPGHFYLSYTLYRHYFPMMALGRYVKAVKEKSEKGFGF